MLFEISTKTFCGFGITKSALAEILQNYKRPLTIMNGSMDRPDFLPPAIECPDGEPTYGYGGLDSLLFEMESNEADCIIGFGGGSAMDYAKAVAALYNTPRQPSINFRGFDKIIYPGIPCICIPTTAGTGSEITPNAVFTDTNEKRKLGINGRHMRATYAILDAEWTLTCPYSVALSSLLDAFVHAIESYMSPEATPLTRALSREAFRLLYQNALSIKAGGYTPDGSIATKTTEERQNLLYGAYLAAMALSNSGSGVVGAMSYPLGVHFGIPHGFAGGIFLPDIMAHNTLAGYDFGGLTALNGLAPSSMWHPAYAIGDLWKRLEVPNLKQWIKPTDVLPDPWISNEALAKNPVPISLTDTHRFVEGHL